MISNSGNTIELLNIIEVISKKKTQNIILLSSKKNSRLSGFCKKNYIVPVQQELKTCFKLIPTNSVVNYIIFANNILGSLINKLDLNETIYKTNHLFLFPLFLIITISKHPINYIPLHHQMPRKNRNKNPKMSIHFLILIPRFSFGFFVINNSDLFPFLPYPFQTWSLK